ncbi:MAG: FitA-like ribbon-helix-helix domain-containing protein [Acetobacteraceae bacterium]
MLFRFCIGGDSEPTATNLSIRNTPDEVAHRLRQRAERHHRSLQGELLAEIRRLGLGTPGESVAIIRADRDPMSDHIVGL